MFIFVDNISNCEEKCSYNVSTIPMTTRIKEAIRKQSQLLAIVFCVQFRYQIFVCAKPSE